ncbi:MAG: hypothetical protein LC775_11435 [Acidobacteria bacterium]|nr:hypothetical protein [Acidobacteriota bacterium]
MIREDRELLAELPRLNTDMPSLALRIMEGSASAQEQTHYAERLIAAGERLGRRAATVGATVIEGDVVEEQVALTSSDGGKQSVALPSHTVEPDWWHTTHVLESIEPDRHP